MRNAAPPLLPLLRSRTQGDLLALLFLHPDQEYTLTRAAALVGVPPSTMHHEVNRLVENGLAVDRRVGQARRAISCLPAFWASNRQIPLDLVRGDGGSARSPEGLSRVSS